MSSRTNNHRFAHLRKAEWFAIRLCEPDTPAAKILDQARILIRSHLSRPNNFGMIDIRFVVHPFVEWIVIRSIAHDYQMTSGHLI